MGEKNCEIISISITERLKLIIIDLRNFWVERSRETKTSFADYYYDGSVFRWFGVYAHCAQFA